AKASDRPFFLPVLTSATHHPYRLPKTLTAPGTPPQRYARLVEAEDALLGDILKALDDNKLTGSTIVVALGDHGEGFGDRGVRQHDNNYFEEGLHVPFVIAGP